MDKTILLKLTENKKLQLSLAIFAGLISLFLIFIPLDNVKLASLGYLGLFLGSVISTATIVFPTAFLVIPFIAGAKLNPLLVALISGLGMGLGEITGYVIGYGTSSIVINKKWHGKVSGWMHKNGWLTIFLLALIPTGGLFDIAGLVAGSTHYKLTKFLSAAFLGKMGRAFILSYSGAHFKLF